MSSYQNVGELNMPDDFLYRDVASKGKPQHEKYDSFYAKHPFMDMSNRAKIFAPFDALKGFSEAIADKDEMYEPKIILSEEVRKKIGYKLSILQHLTQSSRAANQPRVVVSVTYFVPCVDKNSESYGYRGKYMTVKGICSSIDNILAMQIIVDNKVIDFDDILGIASDDERFLLMLNEYGTDN